MIMPFMQDENTCIHLTIISDDTTGEQVCENCGQVLINNVVDYSTDGFNENFNNARTGPKISITMYDGGLSTVIGKHNFDSSGKAVSHEMRRNINRMRMWDSRTKSNSTAHRNLMIALLEINKIKEKMSLSDAIIERSAYFYRKASEKKMIRGRSIKGIVGACIYAACRELGTTRTIIEISKCMHEKRNIIAKSYRLLFQQLSLEISIPDPTSSIIKFSNNLELSEKIKRDAIFIYDTLKEKQVIAGKKPGAVAATVVYMACIKNNQGISQQQISKISGITQVTIRNRFKEFKQYVQLI
ncbi:transcription initiation factor IIB [Nitrosopumilus ureiphilus]|uniref:Transcription initiation factor IIB n=1 Tax=Nitrosopumilus ureiphilus TaxID=1470067 RepID=A0A7D5M4C6_9ARCH|nr:transcription initiation factor IIB [Nitrosopumilus ureiphilus]QLH06313.1 transcription initiation factor IIB [Nitrosopumilus ureiphilus]